MTPDRIALRYDAVLCDLDGVVYRGDHPVEGAARVVAELRRQGARLLFLTNNSSRTPEQVAERLARFGVEAASEEVLTSAMALAAMLRREGAEGATAFVIGERGVREALAAIGVRVLDGVADRSDLVVVGWDRTVDYDKLRTASLLVERGARLIATNADGSYPAPDGLWPGAGALLAAVTTTTGATPVVVGKPARPLFEAAAEATGAANPLVVGDRLDTDVRGAAAIGWDSLLVLTGASAPPALLSSDVLPTYVGPDLGRLLEDVPPARFRPARPDDVGAIGALLEDAGLGADGVEERLNGTVVCGEDVGPLLATASLQAVDDSAILRSVAVRKDLRGKGIGMLAAAAAARQAARWHVRTLALFTETAPRFFERLGFRVVERSSVPAAVRSSEHAARECPSATAMLLDLGGSAERRAYPAVEAVSARGGPGEAEAAGA